MPSPAALHSSELAYLAGPPQAAVKWIIELAWWDIMAVGRAKNLALALSNFRNFVVLTPP